MGGDGTSRARARDWIDFDDVAARDGGALRAVVKRARGDGETAGDEDARGRFRVDFKDWDSTRALTASILRVKYGIHGWDIPSGHLVPPVPNRMNYLSWLHTLDALSAPAWREAGDGAHVRVLDVGTGASVIYPLLGAATYGWSFVGSDVTDVALKGAEANARLNPRLDALIEIRDARASDGTFNVLRGVMKLDEKFTFCMCNPPFFESLDEAGLNPNTACGGTPTEMVCEGGEEAFIKAMFRDSLEMKHSIHWFTTMCGKKKTMTKMRSVFHTMRVPAVRTTELVQGKTSRWCIAWSFSKDAAATNNKPLPDLEKLAKVRDICANARK
jgi:23S rRNA (adenine1618-N6)-methyltransferase